MIGLKRHTVRVVKHRPEWAILFMREAEMLRVSIGDIVADIQHVGSTAVPGLTAKSMLDIAVAVPSMDVIPSVVSRLTASGYIDRGYIHEGNYLLVKEIDPDMRTIHLHMVASTSREWQNDCEFRDLLRQNERLRQGYARLKAHLARHYPNNRASYTAGKQAFITDVLDKPARPSQRG
jgi:GrpB-like predicted nucleotidyltransferase (UPF0157 family)